MMPGKDVLSLGECEIEQGVAESHTQFTMKNNQPGTVKVTENRWYDQDRKKRSYESLDEFDPFNEAMDKGSGKSWNPAGLLVREEEFAGEKIMRGTYRKTDGTVGSEIKDGAGFHKIWSEEGKLTDEIPYVDGLIHGEKKEYDDAGTLRAVTTYVKGQREGTYIQNGPNGNVVIRGQFAKDVKEGTWIRFDGQGKEADRSDFKAGKLVKGRNMFLVD